MKKINVIDFFSGCGGTSQGFKESGMNIVLGIDFDCNAAKTYKLNFPRAEFINEDIRNVSTESIESIINSCKRKSEFILFSGCAPCQPFSTQNNRKSENDPRRTLLHEFSRFIKAYEPDFIFIENVPGIQKINKYSTPFFDFLLLLDTLGYHYEYNVISTLSFGVPQDRKRLILLASRHGKITLPKVTHDGKKKKYSTVRDWIFNLPKLTHGTKDPYLDDHWAASLGELNLKRIRATPEGGGREFWNEELKPECHKRNAGYKDVYGRLSWDKPSSVLTTRCTSYSNGRFGHPEQDRALSLREAALLQTFPMTYKFYGNFGSKSQQIGNAVPPLLAKVFGKHIIQSLEQNL